MESKISDNSIVKRDKLPLIPQGWDTLSNPQKGIRVNTYSYFSSDEVFSAIQKSIRRGLSSESIQWVLETFFTGTETRTATWNRLLVISVEDIGPADPFAITHVWNLRKNDPDNWLAIATCAKYLAECKKSRINDWSTIMFHESVKNADNALEAKGGLDCVKDLLVKSLRNKNFEDIMYWCKLLINTSHKVPSRKKNAQTMIWKSFDEVIVTNDFLTCLKEIAMSPGFRWKGNALMIIVHVVFLWCNDIFPDKLPDKMLHLGDKSLTSVYDEFITRKNHVGVPDYALDKHTQKGRLMGRDIEDFIKTGSHLENRDTRWIEIENTLRKMFISIRCPFVK